MIAIDEAYVDAAAPNADAAKNGRGLVLKNKLAKLHVSDDGALIFGECQGSGKDPYQVLLRLRPARAADAPLLLPEPAAPVQALPRPHVRLRPEEEVHPGRGARQTCGQAGEAGRPRREEGGRGRTSRSRSTQAALAKKVKAQLDGIDVLERLTHDLVRLGIGNMNAKLASQMEKQANQLGDAYLPGARAALYRYLQLFADEEGDFTDKPAGPGRAGPHRGPRPARPAARHHQAGPGVPDRSGSKTRTWRSRPTRPSPPGSATPGSSRELKACGLVEPNAELVQLAFNSHDDRAREEFIDTGIWMTLGNGKIRVTQTLPAVQGGQVHQERGQLLPGGPGQGAVRLPRRGEPARPVGRHGPAAAGAEGPGEDPRARPGRLRRRGQGSEEVAQGPAGGQARRSWR